MKTICRSTCFLTPTACKNFSSGPLTAAPDGSVTIGKRCMVGGMVGIVGHLEIADDVYLTGKTMVTHSITRPGLYSGQLPFDEARRFRRNSARFQKLDELAQRVARL